MIRLPVLMVLSLHLAACGSDGVFRPCSLHEGKNDGRAECASTLMPLVPGSKRTFVSAAKRLKASEPPEGQLWLLHGGPGASGTMGLPTFMERIHAFAPRLDVYALDARGTGASQFLECPVQQSPTSEGGAHIMPSEAEACVAALQGGEVSLDAFTFTQSARDLHEYIEANRGVGQRVFLWGASGGTYWARRYLQLFPSSVDAVVLDGLVSPGRNLAIDQLVSTEQIGRRILEQCRADAFCSSRLPDPPAAVAALWKKLDAGHCAALGHGSDEVRQAIKLMLFYAPFNALLPALIGRLDRCTDADVRVVLAVLEPLIQPESPPHAFSEALNLLLVRTELWDDARFQDDAHMDAFVEAVQASSVIAPRYGADQLSVLRRFPRLVEPLASAPLSVSVPVLMLQGELDPSTPADLARRVAEELAGPHQHFVLVPNTAHGVIGGSPTASGVDCGQELFRRFLEDPLAELDTRCVSERLSLDFEGREEAATSGLPNYWDNP